MDINALEKTGELKEIKKKQTQVDPSMQCLSSRKSCKRKRLKGFDFCHKHILEDKNSPFQQCSFIIKSTEERCLNPAPKIENKKTFCLIHTRDPKLKKAHDEIMKRNMKRKLAHCKAVAEAKKPCSDVSLMDNKISPNGAKRSKEENFHQCMENPESGGIYALQDNGDIRYDVSWFGENDSDADSVDSEEEDPLRHAGVWTLEEALKICRDKMIRKRSLYLEQYKRLHILLKKRKQSHLKRISSGVSHSGEDDEVNGTSGTKLLERKALAFYQHLNGTELLLERKGREKRSIANTSIRPLPHIRCNYLENVDRCENQVLPFSKFCSLHICNDPDQRLYRRCNFESMDSKSICSTAVLQVCGLATCDLHTIPLPRHQSEPLQSFINPTVLSKSDSSGLSEETGFQNNAIQSVDGTKQEWPESIANDNVQPPSCLNLNIAETQHQGRITEKPNDVEIEELPNDSKNPDCKDLLKASHKAIEACSPKAAENINSREALGSDGNLITAPVNIMETSIEEDTKKYTSMDEKSSPIVVSGQCANSSHENQPDKLVENCAQVHAEEAKQNE